MIESNKDQACLLRRHENTKALYKVIKAACDGLQMSASQTISWQQAYKTET